MAHLNFDLEDITSTEFGVERECNEGIPTAVPVNAEVKSALQEMARMTWSAMQKKGNPEPYQPSEKHGSPEYLYVQYGNELETMCRQLYDAENITIDASALEEPNSILYYFARFRDSKEQRLTAIRRATYFKGILKSRLVQIISDTLKIVDDPIFKLDNDFDILVDSAYTHIWKPGSFEFFSNLKQAVLDAVPTNIKVIRQNLPFVDFDGICTYASTRPRAARYLASIRNQNLAGIDRQKLIALCNNTGVAVEDVNGILKLEDRHVIGFLEVLDRRRYEVELVPGTRESFQAASRQKIP